MESPWTLDLRPERRPLDPFRAVPAHPVREDQKRSFERPAPDREPRSFNPQTLCFELPPRVRFEAQPMYAFVHVKTNKVLRRFNAVNRQEALDELAAWCARTGRFPPSVELRPS